MNSVADSSREDLEQWIASEIANAREDARPISRLTLTRMASTRFGMNPHDAERFVDAYCDEKAPAVPTMLSTEFGVPYLKVLAALNVVLALGCFILAMKLPSWIFIGLILGLAFLGGSVFCWVRSLSPEEQKGGKSRNEVDVPNNAR